MVYWTQIITSKNLAASKFLKKLVSKFLCGMVFMFPLFHVWRTTMQCRGVWCVPTTLSLRHGGRGGVYTYCCHHTSVMPSYMGDAITDIPWKHYWWSLFMIKIKIITLKYLHLQFHQCQRREGGCACREQWIYGSTLLSIQIGWNVTCHNVQFHCWDQCKVSGLTTK